MSESGETPKESGLFKRTKDTINQLRRRAAPPIACLTLTLLAAACAQEQQSEIKATPTRVSQTSSTAVSREATPTTQVEEHVDFNSLRQKITESPEIIESEKQNLLIIADELEGNYRVLKEFEASPELSELISLRIEALGPLDPSPLYPGLSADEAKRQWVIDNDLFYLHDLHLIEETLGRTENLPPSQPGAPSVLSGVLRGAGDKIIIPYSESGTQQNFEVEIQTENVEVSGDLIAKIMQKAHELPIVGPLRIVLTTQGQIKNESGLEVSAIEIPATKTNPTTIKIAADIAEEQILEDVRHEEGHMLDPDNNPVDFVRALTPAELIQVQIEKARLTRDLMITSNELSLGRVRKGQPITEVLNDGRERENAILADLIARHGHEPGTGAYEYLEEIDKLLKPLR